MTVIQSFLLGLLQGIAEFLPISSSGHLRIAQELFGLEEVPLLFDVILHLSTLLAVCIFFRKKIIELLCFKDKKYIVDVIATTFVTGVLGIVTKKLLDEDKISIKFTCLGLILTAIILVTSRIIEKKRKLLENKTPTLVQSLIVGLAQGIGTLPGISRSGSTIAGGLFCGINRNVARNIKRKGGFTHTGSRAKNNKVRFIKTRCNAVKLANTCWNSYVIIARLWVVNFCKSVISFGRYYIFNMCKAADFSAITNFKNTLFGRV